MSRLPYQELFRENEILHGKLKAVEAERDKLKNDIHKDKNTKKMEIFRKALQDIQAVCFKHNKETGCDDIFCLSNIILNIIYRDVGNELVDLMHKKRRDT